MRYDALFHENKTVSPAMASQASQHSRPTLLDFNATLLTSILQEEGKLWQEKNVNVPCKHIDIRRKDKDEVDCGHTKSNEQLGAEDVASILLGHGRELDNIHCFFLTLTPQQYMKKLQVQIGQDFQVVDHIDKKNKCVYAGTETVKVSYKETQLLHPEDQSLYRCALTAALYPILSSSPSPSESCSPKNSQSRESTPRSSQSDNNDDTQRISPTSQECMMYDNDPMTPSSIFPTDSDDLSEIVRKAFSLTHQGHARYVDKIENLDHDPAKILLDEMRDQLSVLQNNCHPFFHPNNKFYNRECYDRWLHIETSAIEQIIAKQQLLLSRAINYPHANPPLNFKDKHPWYCKLLAKLYKLESPNSCVNFGTNEVVPLGPLSANVLRLLNEFGERYRIGELYRRIALLEYLARNFETKTLTQNSVPRLCTYIASVIKSIVHAINTDLGEFIMKEEIQMFQRAVRRLRDRLRNTLKALNRIFPRNSPEGALRAVLELLAILFDVDQIEIFQGEELLFPNRSLTSYIKKYLQEEMFTKYEGQKMIIFAQLNIPAFEQQSTPKTINLLILGVSEMLRNYRMYYRDEFLKYSVDIFEMAIEIFYGLLMQDVEDLCNTYPVNHQLENIDYHMIALAYRLASFDREQAWEEYIVLEKQTWREPFLKHSLSWMHSLHRKLEDSVLKALQQDSWNSVILSEEQTTATTSAAATASSNLGEDVTRPRNVPKRVSPDVPSQPARYPTFQPSATSAFVKVTARSSTNTPQDASSSVVESREEEPMPDDTSQEPDDTSPKTENATPPSPPADPSNHTLEKGVHDEGSASVPSTSQDVDLIISPESPLSTNATSRVPNIPESPLCTSPTTSHVPSIPESPAASSSIPRSFQTCASSNVDTTEYEDFQDARSYMSTLEDPDEPRDEPCQADVTADEPEVADYRPNRLIPVSSSLVDTICAVNRVVSVVLHITQLLCPVHKPSSPDALRINPEEKAASPDLIRISPEERSEMRYKLETGRAKMARELSTMLGLTVSFYGCYVISVECRGIDDDTLKSIIGQRCLTKFRDLCSFVRDSDVRDTRHTAVTERPTRITRIPRVDYFPVHCELFAKEMCIRLNNVRTLRDILLTLIESAVGIVVEVNYGAEVDSEVLGTRDRPSTSKWFPNDEECSSPATSSSSLEGCKIIDSESVTKSISELQEIEEGLSKIIAYRANITISQLFRLVLSLDLRSFSNRKLLQPVLNTTRRTIDTLASYLYHDCFALVLRGLWLNIVKDFENEKENLVFLNGTSKEQANILLDGIQCFIEIFRAEGDVVSLVFITQSIEQVSQSLYRYILTTSNLIDVYTGLQTKIDNAAADRREEKRQRAQGAPSDRLIANLRIELESHRHRHFSGNRFVTCVEEQIRYAGDWDLGICAVPNGRDETKAVSLGQYLLDTGVLRYIGKAAPKFKPGRDQFNEDFDNENDEEVQCHAPPGSVLFFPGKKIPTGIFNNIPVYNTQFNENSAACDSTGSPPSNSGFQVVDGDDKRGGSFLNSDNTLYEFEFVDIEEKDDSTELPEITNERERQTKDDIIRVLFTRRYVDQRAKEFLSNLQDNALLEDLYVQYALRYPSFAACCTPSVTPA